VCYILVHFIFIVRYSLLLVHFIVKLLKYSNHKSLKRILSEPFSKAKLNNKILLWF